MNRYTFERAINIAIKGGGTFGGPTTAMDRNHDRLVFAAIGATPGFTWVIDGITATTTTAAISPDGLTLTIDAPFSSTPRTFAEFGISTNGQLTAVDVTHSTPARVAGNNARFQLHVPACETVDADLSITKTNTPGVNGEVDQANDVVTSGATTTYTLVVTNNGPDVVSGAIVSDVISSGLNCAANNPVTIEDAGVPSGAFTISDLTGGGIALATLANGEFSTLTYSCQVN